MTIAIHEPSNSLIITAPDLLFQEVEQLVKMIDARNETVIDIISIEDAAVIGTLQSVLGEESATNQGGGFGLRGNGNSSRQGSFGNRNNDNRRTNQRNNFRRGRDN